MKHLTLSNRLQVLLALGLLILPNGLTHTSQAIKEWFHSANVGDISTMGRLIQNQFNVNCTDKSGATALMRAAHFGNTDTIKALIKAKSNTNLISDNGYTALMLAASSRSPNCEQAVRILLGSGASLPTAHQLKLLSEGARAIIHNNTSTQEANTQKPTDLIHTIKYGDKKVAKKLIKSGADVNLRDKFGMTPLISASHDGHANIARSLILAGVNPNATTTNKMTALMFASQNGHIDFVEELIKARVDLNKTNATGATALDFAAHFGYINIVNALIRAGAIPKLNSQNRPAYLDTIAYSPHQHNEPVLKVFQKPHNKYDLMPYNKYYKAIGLQDMYRKPYEMTTFHLFASLMDAAYEGNINTVKEIITNKTYINQSDEMGTTPLMASTKTGKIDIVKLLIKAGAFVHQADINGDTALIVAVQNGQQAIINELIKTGALVNDVAKNGATPLIFAAHFGHISIVNTLLQGGADLNLVAKDNHTALMRAASSQSPNCERIVKLLLNSGASLPTAPQLEILSERAKKIIEKNTLTHQDNTQNFNNLINAIRGEDIDAVKRLVKAGTNLNQHKGRATPLIHATQSGNIEIVKVLLKAGANPRQESTDHVTPLKVASSIKHSSIVNLLIKAGASPSAMNCQINTQDFTELMRAIHNSDADSVKKLATDSNLKQTDKKGTTPLITAIRKKDNNIANLLIKAGANPNQADGKGATPLITAIRAKDNNIANLLIKAGANPNQTDRKGVTPLIAAIRTRNKDILKLLINVNTNPNQTDKQGNTPLIAALKTQLGNETLKLLIKAGANVNKSNKEGFTPLMLASSKYYKKITIQLLLKSGAEAPTDSQLKFINEHAKQVINSNKPLCKKHLKKRIRTEDNEPFQPYKRPRGEEDGDDALGE